MQSVKFYAECHYAECRYAECRGANLSADMNGSKKCSGITIAKNLAACHFIYGHFEKRHFVNILLVCMQAFQL